MLERRQRMGLYFKDGKTFTPLVLCWYESLKQANKFTGIVNTWQEWWIDHIFCSTGHYLDTVELRQSQSKSGCSMKWCRRLQLSSYAVKESGLVDRSSPLSFSSFFSRPGAQAVALQRQPPWARLRTVCRDWGDRVSKNKKSAGTARFAADKKKRWGGRGGCIRAGNSALPFGLLLYHTTIKTWL